MRAAVYLAANEPLSIREYPLTDPAAGMAVVDLVASGICGTDIHIWEGALAIPGPMIPGHEFLGRIRALGEGDNLDCFQQPVQIGDLVIVNVIESCGDCPLCQNGGAASCVHLGESITYTHTPKEAPHFHGGFAEVNYSPTRYLQKVTAAIPEDVIAAFLCAGPTVVRGVDYAGGFRPGAPVVIQGSGPVGLFAVRYARHAGADPIILIGSGSHPLRMPMARELGADVVLDIRASTVEERRAQVMDLTDGLGAEMIIEGAGHPSAVTEGINLLRLRGRYVLAGQYSDRGTIDFAPHLITANALQIFGSAQFTAQDRARYLQLLAAMPEQWTTIARLITDRFPIEQATEALAKVRDGASLRAIFVKG